MMRVFKVLLLALLWGLWLYFFIGVCRFAYAFTHNVAEAILPGSPVGLDARETWDWIESVALLYGTPVLLGVLTWWSFFPDASPTFRKNNA
jgi:hypothetical protein